MPPATGKSVFTGGNGLMIIPAVLSIWKEPVSERYKAIEYPDQFLYIEHRKIQP